MRMMMECMNGSTGTVRHDDYTSADFEVTTEESFASSTWCAACVQQYIECGMGRYLETVRVVRTEITEEMRTALDTAKACGALVTETVD